MLRSRIVTLAAYAKHMLKYQDGQFSRHPLFRYYIFNWIIREQALNATYFLYSQLDKNSLSLDKLNNLINSTRGNQVLNKIIQYIQKLKGTRPYQKQKRNKLTAYAKNIKSGSLFFILSATNLYQYNLYFYIPLFNKNIRLLIRLSATRLLLRILIITHILLLTGYIAALIYLGSTYLQVYLIALTFSPNISGRRKVAAIYIASYRV